MLYPRAASVRFDRNELLERQRRGRDAADAARKRRLEVSQYSYEKVLRLEGEGEA